MSDSESENEIFIPPVNPRGPLGQATRSEIKKALNLYDDQSSEKFLAFEKILTQTRAPRLQKRLQTWKDIEGDLTSHGDSHKELDTKRRQPEDKSKRVAMHTDANKLFEVVFPDRDDFDHLHGMREALDIQRRIWHDRDNRSELAQAEEERLDKILLQIAKADMDTRTANAKLYDSSPDHVKFINSNIWEPTGQKDDKGKDIERLLHRNIELLGHYADLVDKKLGAHIRRNLALGFESAGYIDVDALKGHAGWREENREHIRKVKDLSEYHAMGSEKIRRQPPKFNSDEHLIDLLQRVEKMEKAKAMERVPKSERFDIKAPISYSFGIVNIDKVRLIIWQKLNNLYSWASTRMKMESVNTVASMLEHIYSSKGGLMLSSVTATGKKRFEKEIIDITDTTKILKERYTDKEWEATAIATTWEKVEEMMHIQELVWEDNAKQKKKRATLQKAQEDDAEFEPGIQKLDFKNFFFQFAVRKLIENVIAIWHPDLTDKVKEGFCKLSPPTTKTFTAGEDGKRPGWYELFMSYVLNMGNVHSVYQAQGISSIIMLIMIQVFKIPLIIYIDDSVLVVSKKLGRKTLSVYRFFLAAAGLAIKGSKTEQLPLTWEEAKGEAAWATVRVLGFDFSNKWGFTGVRLAPTEEITKRMWEVLARIQKIGLQQCQAVVQPQEFKQMLTDALTQGGDKQDNSTAISHNNGEGQAASEVLGRVFDNAGFKVQEVLLMDVQSMDNTAIAIFNNNPVSQSGDDLPSGKRRKCSFSLKGNSNAKEDIKANPTFKRKASSPVAAQVESDDERIMKSLEVFCGLVIAAGGAWIRHPARVLTSTLYKYRHHLTTFSVRDIVDVLRIGAEICSILKQFPNRVLGGYTPTANTAFIKFDAALVGEGKEAEPVIGAILFIDNRVLTFSKVLKAAELKYCPMTVASSKSKSKYRIDFLESLSLLTAVDTWGPLLVNRSVLIAGDNLTQVRTVARGFSAAPGLLSLAEEFNVTAVKFRFSSFVFWMPSAMNIADHLTRGFKVHTTTFAMKFAFDKIPKWSYFCEPRISGGWEQCLSFFKRAMVLSMRKKELMKAPSFCKGANLRDSHLKPWRQELGGWKFNLGVNLLVRKFRYLCVKDKVTVISTDPYPIKVIGSAFDFMVQLSMEQGEAGGDL